MTRFKLLIEYDGTGFVGWQRQKNGRSIQETIEDAIGKFCGEKVLAQGAGRTDAGVHAYGQVAHVDIKRRFKAETVRNAINAHLRSFPISVLSVEKTTEQFHARFSAKERVYIYRIINRSAPLAVDKNRAWKITTPLDAMAMHDSAQILIGKHDFTSFRAKQCQASSPVKTLSTLQVNKIEEKIEILVRAPSFLHHQVRNIVGTLKLVGEGKWTVNDFAAVLKACDRNAAGPTAPPEGLFLKNVSYPKSTF